MAGTLLLGSLWGLWHLPLFLFIPGFNGSGTGFLGIGLPFVEFVIFAVALRLSSPGSLITSVAACCWCSCCIPPTLPGSYLFLSLVRLVNVNIYLVFVAVAVLIIVATRGRLSYERYLRETALPAPVTDREQEKGEVRTAV